MGVNGGGCKQGGKRGVKRGVVNREENGGGGVNRDR